MSEILRDFGIYQSKMAGSQWESAVRMAEEIAALRAQLAGARAEIDQWRNAVAVRMGPALGVPEVPGDVDEAFDIVYRDGHMDGVAEMQAALTAAEAAREAVAGEVREARDRDWVLALATAAGTNSGLMVPIVPEVGPCRELLAAAERRGVELYRAGMGVQGE